MRSALGKYRNVFGTMTEEEKAIRAWWVVKLREVADWCFTYIKFSSWRGKVLELPQSAAFPGQPNTADHPMPGPEITPEVPRLGVTAPRPTKPPAKMGEQT